jgi:hypothetical protein
VEEGVKFIKHFKEGRQEIKVWKPLFNWFSLKLEEKRNMI